MELKSVKRFRLTTTLQAASSLHRTEQDGRDAYGRIILAPSYLLTDQIRGTVTGSLIQNNNEEEKTVFGNTKLTLSRKPLQLGTDTSLVLIGGGRLPTNPDDRRDNTYQGALLIEPYVMHEMKIFGQPVTGTYQLQATKNFHKYDRNNVSAANMSYSFLNYVSLDTYIMKNVVLTLEGDYTYARSYQDTPKTLFSLGQVLTYEQPQWSVSVGHTNSANAFKPNGRDSNVTAFDQNTSSVYGTLRLVY